MPKARPQSRRMIGLSRRCHRDTQQDRVAKNDVGNRDRRAAALMAPPEPARRRATRTEPALAALILISEMSEISKQ